MKNFTNETILSYKKKGLTIFLIAILLFLVGGVFIALGNKEVKKQEKTRKDLNTIITSEKNKTDKSTYLDVKVIPYKFAVYDNTTDSYYILSDGEYLYVAYMSVEDYALLNDESIYDKAIRIKGMTKQTPKDIKNLAIEAYNESIEEEEEKLTLADYNNYFGEVHIDTTQDETSAATPQYLVAIVCNFIGMVLLLTALIQKLTFNRSLKKLDPMEIEKLDSELNDPNAFYYAKAHLYLTNNYVVNLAGKFQAYKYSSILWMYPYEHRVNGVRVSKGIKIFTEDGKTLLIANMDTSTKKKKEVYQEIWDTIVSKNNKIVLGYTSENIKHMREVSKEIKRNKKLQ